VNVVGDIFQPTHLLLILVVALLVLGPARLPQVARSLGQGIRDFRSATSFDDDRANAATIAPIEADSAPTEIAKTPNQSLTDAHSRRGEQLGGAA
jgi:sec-independent protein translocase protein TatA